MIHGAIAVILICCAIAVGYLIGEKAKNGQESESKSEAGEKVRR